MNEIEKSNYYEIFVGSIGPKARSDMGRAAAVFGHAPARPAALWPEIVPPDRGPLPPGSARPATIDRCRLGA